MCNLNKDIGPMKVLFMVWFSVVSLLSVGVNAADIDDIVGKSEVVVVKSARVGAKVALSGTVIPHRQVTLTAQMPGQVELVAGEEGDRFNEGEKLVALDEDVLLAKKSEAEAALRSAYSQEYNARAQWQRELASPNAEGNSMMGGLPSMMSMMTDPVTNMTGKRDTSVERRANITRQRTMVDQARSNISQGQSKIRQIDSKLSDAKSYAPFDGVIIKKMVEQGDTIQPGTPLVMFADTSRLQLAVEVPARHMPALSEGMIVRAKLDVNETRIKARVAKIYPMANARSHTVTVKFDIPPGVPAAPGMYAVVYVPDATAKIADLPVIPSSSIIQRGSLPGVYVVNDQGQMELRLIRLGERLNGDTVSVLSGLKVGEKVSVRAQEN